MKITVIAIVAILASSQASPTLDLFSEEHIRHVNAQARTWTAGRNFPEGTTLAQIRSLLGTVRVPERKVLEVLTHDEDEEVPESFDAREQWKDCASIREVRDQSACGSCWAVAAVSAMSDRICIHSKGKNQAEVSAVNLMGCCDNCGFGCKGGFPSRAWDFWVRNGIVSGGEYGSNKGCQPYTFPQCEHDTDGSNYGPCPSDMYPTPECVKQCANKSLNYEGEILRGRTAYRLNSNEKQIRIEIFKNGPLETDFTVFSDFMLYKNGVYQATPDAEILGGHAVKVIGWGTENDVPYWLVANSWNQDWGDNGMFKIRRGNDECCFEDDMVGGLPSL